MNMNNNLSYWVERDILFLQIKGKNKVDDILGLYETAFADKSTPAKVSIIVDARFSGNQNNEEEKIRFTDGLRKYSLRIIQQAIVVSKDSQFIDIRQTSSYSKSDGYEVQSFREIESARDWVEDIPLMGVCGICAPRSK